MSKLWPLDDDDLGWFLTEAPFEVHEPKVRLARARARCVEGRKSGNTGSKGRRTANARGN